MRRGLSGYSSGKRRHMSFHEFAKIWRSHSSESENLYLKDWHFASEFPNYKVGQHTDGELQAITESLTVPRSQPSTC